MSIIKASLVAQMVKNVPAMQETLGQKDPLGKGVDIKRKKWENAYGC